MSSNPQFSELANWDGKLSQAGSSTSSPRMNTANLTGSRTPNTQVNTSIDLIPTRTLPALFTVANSGVTAQSPQVNGKVDTAVSMFPSSSSVTSPPRSSEPIRVSEKSIAPESLPTTVQCLQPLPPIPTHSSNTPPSLPQISKPTSPEMHTAASDTRFDHSQGSEAELEEMLVVDSILKEPSVSSISSVDTSSPSVSLLEGNGTVAAAPRSPELKNTKPSSIKSMLRNWGLSSPLPPSSPEKPSEGDSSVSLFHSDALEDIGRESPVKSAALEALRQPRSDATPVLPVRTSIIPPPSLVRGLQPGISNPESFGKPVNHLLVNLSPSPRSTSSSRPLDMQSNNRNTSPQRPRAPTKSENITLPEQHNTPPRSSLSKLIPSPSRTSVVPTVLNTSTPSSSSPTQSSSKPLLQTQGRFSLINVLAEEEQEDEGFGPVIVNDEMVVQDLASVPDPDSLPRASRVNGPDTSDHPRKLATDHNPGLAMVHLRAKDDLATLLRQEEEEPPSSLTTISSSSPFQARTRRSNFRGSKRKGKNVKGTYAVFTGVFIPPFPLGIAKKVYIEASDVSVLVPKLRRDAAGGKKRRSTVNLRTKRESLRDPVQAKPQPARKRRISSASSNAPWAKKARLSTRLESRVYPEPDPEIDDNQAGGVDDEKPEVVEHMWTSGEGLDPLSKICPLLEVNIEEAFDLAELEGLEKRMTRWMQDMRLAASVPQGVDTTLERERFIVGRDEGDWMEKFDAPVEAVSGTAPRIVEVSPMKRIKDVQPVPQPSDLVDAEETTLPSEAASKTSVSPSKTSQLPAQSTPSSVPPISEAPPSSGSSSKPPSYSRRKPVVRQSSGPIKVVSDKDTSGDVGNFTTSNIPNFVSLSMSTTPPIAHPISQAGVQPVQTASPPPEAFPPPSQPISFLNGEASELDAYWLARGTYYSQQHEQSQAYFPGVYGTHAQPHSSSSTVEPELSIHSSNSIVAPLGIYGNGTIDPSLLGCSPLDQNGSGSPASTSSLHSISGSAGEGSRGSTSGMHTVGFTYHGPTEEGRGGEETRKRKGRGKGRPVEPGAGGGKGKGKGKEQDPLNGLAVRGQSVISAEGKRRQKLSTKARDATEATEKGGMHANDGAFEMTDEDADGSTVAEDDKEGEEDGIKISVKTGPARKRQDKSNPRLVKALQSNKPLTNGILKQLAEEPTTCHHCRRKTHVEKMRCTVFKAFGPCGKRYCVSCVLKRYPDVTFNPYAVNFECPCCRNMCNCTVCSRKRGEEYIPQSRARIPYIIPEYLPTPTSQPLPKPASPPPNTSNDPKPSNSLLGRSVSTMQQRKSSATNPSFDLPERAFWGTIYGPDGNPVGKGFMGDGNQQIIIQNGETEPPSLPLEPLPKLRSRTRRKTKSSLEFIGQLRDRWCTKPPRPSPSTDPSTTAPEVPAGSRTYIGRRVSLFDKSYKSLDDHSFSATMSMQQRTSPSSDPSHGPQTGNLFDESSPTASFGGNKASDPPGQISEDIMGFLLAEILKPADPLNQNT